MKTFAQFLEEKNLSEVSMAGARDRSQPEVGDVLNAGDVGVNMAMKRMGRAAAKPGAKPLTPDQLAQAQAQLGQTPGAPFKRLAQRVKPAKVAAVQPPAVPQ